MPRTCFGNLLVASFLSLAFGCKGDGATGPSPGDTVGPIGPFPADVTGKVVFGTDVGMLAKVHVVDTADPSDRIIFTMRGVWIDGLSWAPDGVRLALQTTEPHFGSGSTVWQLHRLSSAAGGNQDQVLFDEPGPKYRVAYSSRWQLAYFGGWSNDPESGVFIDGNFVHRTIYDAGSSLSWAPDASALVYTSSTYFGPLGLSKLNLVDRAVTQLLAPENGETITQAAFSPDGSRIAFRRFDSSNNGEEIWTVTASGADPQQITKGFADGFPAWTPDGKYIAFSRMSGPDRGIYLVASTGGTPTRVIGGRYLTHVAWSR